jgi:NTE family protein
MARAAANKAKDRKTSASPPFERVALLLQGGGALGAYQGGVYQALAEANVLPTWIAGISIGAVNSAIIAGNAPENRVARLREFWEAVSSSPLAVLGTPFSAAINKDNQIHRLVNQLQALRIALLGAPSFFTPRFPPPSPWAPQDPKALSFYDVSPLHATLERLVDFDRINSGEIRFSVGATNVQTGDFAYFDNTTHKIEARHIVASGSLPPGFPATEVDGEYYWDGGLVSNTPLLWVLDSLPRCDTLAFQVDLWSSSGEPPHDLTQADVRQKEIQFASRTRFVTDLFRKQQMLRHTVRHVIGRLPPNLRTGPDIEVLTKEADESAFNIVELIYHSKSYEGIAKDYEFSRLTMEEHWTSGYEDAARALAHPEIFQPADNLERFETFDFSRYA